jgi:hypothetical protein
MAGKLHACAADCRGQQGNYNLVRPFAKVTTAGLWVAGGLRATAADVDAAFMRMLLACGKSCRDAAAAAAAAAAEAAALETEGGVGEWTGDLCCDGA